METSPLPPVPDVPLRGPLAFCLLGLVGALGPDITPSSYYPGLGRYIPRYVILAVSVGLGLSACRSDARIDRAFGVPVFLVGLGMVCYIASDCLRILGY